MGDKEINEKIFRTKYVINNTVPAEQSGVAPFYPVEISPLARLPWNQGGLTPARWLGAVWRPPVGTRHWGVADSSGRSPGKRTPAIRGEHYFQLLMEISNMWI